MFGLPNHMELACHDSFATCTYTCHRSSSKASSPPPSSRHESTSTEPAMKGRQHQQQNSISQSVQVTLHTLHGCNRRQHAFSLCMQLICASHRARFTSDIEPCARVLLLCCYARQHRHAQHLSCWCLKACGAAGCT